jgi:hypothetical protein
MVNGYTRFLALSLVYFIVMPDMRATGGVTSLVKCLPDPMPLDEGPIISEWSVSSFLFQYNWIAYLQVLHQRPTSVVDLPSDPLNLAGTLSVIIKRRSFVESFFTGLSSSLSPRWWSLRSSP